MAPVVVWDYECPDGRIARCAMANVADAWEVRFTLGAYVDTVQFSSRRKAMQCAIRIERMLLDNRWVKLAHTYPDVFASLSSLPEPGVSSSSFPESEVPCGSPDAARPAATSSRQRQTDR